MDLTDKIMNVVFKLTDEQVDELYRFLVMFCSDDYDKLKTEIKDNELQKYDNLNILIGTDIVLDYLMKRELFVKEAEKIFNLCKDRVNGYVSIITVVDSMRATRNYYDMHTCKLDMALLLDFIKVVDTVDGVIDKVLDDELFNEYNDALQYYTAKYINAYCIVTRDKKYSIMSHMKVLTPTEFLNL